MDYIHFHLKILHPIERNKKLKKKKSLIEN